MDASQGMRCGRFGGNQKANGFTTYFQSTIQKLLVRFVSSFLIMGKVTHSSLASAFILQMTKNGNGKKKNDKFAQTQRLEAVRGGGGMNSNLKHI